MKNTTTNTENLITKKTDSEVAELFLGAVDALEELRSWTINSKIDKNVTSDLADILETIYKAKHISVLGEE